MWPARLRLFVVVLFFVGRGGESLASFIVSSSSSAVFLSRIWSPPPKRSTVSVVIFGVPSKPHEELEFPRNGFGGLWVSL